MDKIPLTEVKQWPDGKRTLYDIPITECEYANAEKVNQLIDWNRELQDRLIKVEGK